MENNLEGVLLCLINICSCSCCRSISIGISFTIYLVRNCEASEVGRGSIIIRNDEETVANVNTVA